PEDDVAHPPLGQMLVERGFITEEQLQNGLAEQGRTGLPLGQVLIGLSYVTAATIAQALATQEGGVVRTEFGLSTGFDTPGLVALPPVSPAAPTPFSPVVLAPEPAHVPVPAPEPAHVPVPVPMAVPVPEPEPAQEAAPELEREPEPMPEREPEPEPVVEPAPLLPAASTTSARIAELVERELATAAGAAAAEISAAHARIADLEEQMAGLRQQAEAARGAEDLLAASSARAGQLELDLAAARTRAAELDHELFALRQRAEAAEAALASANERAGQLEAEIGQMRAADAAETRATRSRVADLEAEAESARSSFLARLHALELERDARARELQQTQAQLASSTENLRSAYERLHQFEIAQALQQHQAGQPQAEGQQSRPASPFAWQS
ncbi:MAG: hypothetical protein KGI93_05325, partial [Acidobacteriota bacterium]|nr:hypothetical protein [Acidobacteriota bacterium]